MADIYPDDDLLIRYLDGELSAPEAAAVEARLKTDGRLRDRLTNLRIAVQAVRHLGATEQVSIVHRQMMLERGISRKDQPGALVKFIRYSMAVAAALLLLFFGVRVYLANQNSPEKLYATAFVDFSVSASRSRGTGLSTIEQQYSQKQYETITSTSRSLHLDLKDSLLMGLSFLQTNRLQQAIGFFTGLASFENEYRHDAEFYLALTYLKKKDYVRSLPLLQKISAAPAHLYHERVSKDFVEKIKELHANQSKNPQP